VGRFIDEYINGEQMKIIWVTKLTDRDPFKNTQLGVSEALRKRGHGVRLIMARNFTEKHIIYSNRIYIPTIEYPLFSGIIFGLFIFWYLPFIVKKEKSDILIVDGDSIWSPFFLLLKIINIPIIWDIRSLPIDREHSPLHDISLYLSRYIVDGYTTITTELRDILIERYKLQDKKIGIWSSGVSREIFLKKYTEQSDIRIKYPNMFILLYHGTYSPTRGIEDLVRSLSEINPIIREKIKLLIVGITSKKQGDITKLCDELKIRKNVEIIPPVESNKIPLYIQAAHVGVIPLPPNNEWWRVSVPLKTLEYLAMGKPILATSIPFHQKLFKMCECGVIVDSSDPKVLANGIITLYKRKEELDEIGRKGKEIVEKYYTWEHQALKLEKYLLTVLEWI
jgi:glycosyltransferase involved in cell wall biosynthesis